MQFFSISPEILQAIQIILTLLVLYYVIFTIGLAIWAYQDIRRRTRHWPVHLLATVLVLVFNLPGLLLYMLVRPPETLSQQYEQALEEAVILQDLGKQLACPRCKRGVQEDFLICPYCRTQLKRPCGQCGQPLSALWHACPYCTTPIALEPPEAAPPALSPASEPIATSPAREVA